MQGRTDAIRGRWFRTSVTVSCIAIAGCGTSTGLIVTSSGEDNPCVPLAEETIALSQQLLDDSEQTGELDATLTCQFLANEIELVDMGCITESELPAGVDRSTLVLQQQDFSCDSQSVTTATQ